MSRRRIIIAAFAVLTLTGLLAWQNYRLRLVATCVEAGGYWDGPRSVCEPDRGRIRIQRDLRRS